jgi:hypothetical protein
MSFIQAPSYGDLRLTIEDLPNPVKLHQPINLTCRITNTRFVYKILWFLTIFNGCELFLLQRKTC